MKGYISKLVKQFSKLLSKIKDTNHDRFSTDYKIKAVLTMIADSKKRPLLLPKNFDPEEHIKKYPPVENGFPKNIKFRIDKMLHFPRLLSEIPAYSKDSISETGFVNINAEIIKDKIKDYKHYKNYLLATNVLECDGLSIPNIKSYGYKWKDTYLMDSEGSPIEFVLSKIYTTTESVEEDDKEVLKNSISLENYPYLKFWYNDLLQFDYDGAREYALQLTNSKLKNKESWDINKDTGEKKHPILQYHAALTNIELIRAKRYKVHIDDNIHRLHSVITYLQKEYRLFFTYNNQMLVALDLSNSQPFISTLILNRNFWLKESNLPINLYNLPNNVSECLSYNSISIMMGKFFESYPPEKFQKYINIVSNGQLYQTIAKIANARNKKQRDVKEIKLYTLIYFYSKTPENINAGFYWFNRLISNEFPEVAELISMIKTELPDGGDKQYNRLSILLSNIESELILHRCCKRIWEEGKQSIPILTIHDSIITSKENVDFVYGVMIDEINKCIGFRPNIKLEPWEK